MRPWEPRERVRVRRVSVARALVLIALCGACGPAEEVVEVDADTPRLDPLPDVIPADWIAPPQPEEDAGAPEDSNATEDTATIEDVTAPRDVRVTMDVPRDGVTARDVVDVARVDVAPAIPPGCARSASGASSTWTCNTERTARQRCVNAMTETVRCEYGCNPGAGGANATCSCGTRTNFTVWNCLADGNLHKCQNGAWLDQSCDGRGCSVRPTGTDDVCNPPAPPPGTLACSNVQWWNSYITYEHVSYGWRDTDLRMAAGTPVQLRHNSRLDRSGVHAWGYMPEFTDLTTGARFRFLHLRPQNQYATTMGRTYPAGFIVGLSGGDTRDTGYPTYSTGAHLCVQTLVTYRNAFPSGRDACR